MSLSPRIIVLIAAGCFALVICLALIQTQFFPYTVRTKTSPAVFMPEELTIEVADTDDSRIKGLSGREDVPTDYAMVFVFPEEGRYGFWMKDMLVPLDIIWLSNEGIIVHIEEDVSPATYPKVFFPPKPSTYVLEMRQGTSKSYALMVGPDLSGLLKTLPSVLK